MSSDISEKDFQRYFYTYLVNTGYVKRTTKNYDVEYCLDAELVLKFVKSTQPKKWAKFARHNGGDEPDTNGKHYTKSEVNFIESLVFEIKNRGTIDVLKNGFKDISNFKLFYSKPYNDLNPKQAKKFNQNIFSVVDELEYQNKKHGNRLDLVIFINGIPISTIELKDTFSQGVEKAMAQYMETRNPNEQLFKNCLVHFAMSDENIQMTTKLNGEDTKFLPFNKGIENPVVENDYKTSYMYTEILQKDQLSRLINNFIFEEDGKVIFPRFHQLDCVNCLLSNPKPGTNYLVQHSAGSGKTKTLSWLAHNLINKYDENNKRVYDMVIVISDRTVIDDQLQEQVKAIESTDDVVEVIDVNSKQLAEALMSSSNIVVSTLHKFSYIFKEVGNLRNRNYAIIVDEAHSSQTGAHSSNLRYLLSDAELDELDLLDPEDYIEKKLGDAMKKRSHTPNLSFFAFTATPKAKTLELFGKKLESGKYEAHHLYTMEQAIEEGFILDVLKHYINYPTYFRLMKNTLDDPEYDEAAAKKLLRKEVEKDDISIERKTSVILNHFLRSTQQKIKGHAKAMVVASGREEAVKYKLELDKQIKSMDIDLDIETLCAFTGSVNVNGEDYTEDKLNKIGNKSIKETFHKEDKYKILVVANKFQTGFDESLLHTMYVDKKLNGVAAVQTLSRLNRMHDDKDDTMVIDFVNNSDIIKRAFEPYYRGTVLSEGTDYHKLYELMGNIFHYRVFDEDDVDEFIKAYENNASQQQLHNLLHKPITKYKELSTEYKVEFKRKLGRYQNIYSFLSQLIPFCDVELEKLYIYNRLLLKKLPTINRPLPYSLLAEVDLTSYKVDINHDPEDISPDGGDGELDPMNPTDSKYKSPERARLSQIVETLNEISGDVEFDDEEYICKKLIAPLLNNTELMNQIAINPETTVREIFNDPFEKALLNLDINLYNKINNDHWLKERLKNQTLGYLYERQKVKAT